jgi:hypothetical protein
MHLQNEWCHNIIVFKCYVKYYLQIFACLQTCDDAKLSINVFTMEPSQTVEMLIISHKWVPVVLLTILPCPFVDITTGQINWRWWNIWWRILTWISMQQMSSKKLLWTMLESKFIHGNQFFHNCALTCISVFLELLHHSQVLSATVHECVVVDTN